MIQARLELPHEFPAVLTVRLRAPEDRHLQGTTLGRPKWNDFDAATETITIPPGSTQVVAHYG